MRSNQERSVFTFRAKPWEAIQPDEKQGQPAVPLYANAALIRPGYQPGQYPSAGPLPEVDAITFFVGSIFFTSAAFLQYLEVVNTEPVGGGLQALLGLGDAVDQELRLRMTYLSRLLERYIAQKEFEADDNNRRMHLLVGLRKRGLVTAVVYSGPFRKLGETQARIFGDQDDPNSKIAQVLKAKKSFRLQEEKGTKPGAIWPATKGPSSSLRNASESV